jgi:hypothetical protein
MKPSHPARRLTALALLAALCPAAALAAERDCPAIAIEPDAGFRERFPDLLERIRAELAARPNLDACARVELGVQDVGLIGVSVTLPDGRTALRSVTRRDDVLPTLQALLLVPDHADAPPKLSPPPPRSQRAQHAQHAVQPERGDRDLPTPVLKPRELGFELSLISGARIGDGQFGYGAGVLSFLEVKSWLLGFQGRADGYRSLSGGDPETALELAILAGKRFDFAQAALDLSAGPGVAMKGVAFSQSESAPVLGMPAPASLMRPRSEPSSGPVARLLVGARLGFRPRSIFRGFVGIDGEWGPAREPGAFGDDISSPRMPRYAVGLTLGATVGTP